MSSHISPIKSAKLVKFRAWLTERGAELLVETNQYEVIRYRAGDQTHVVYRNDGNTRWTAVNGAAQALNAFLSGHAWRAPIPRVRRGTSMNPQIYNALVARDGDRCFYCGLPVPEPEATNEHMVAKAHGGPNHMSNFALAHSKCNADAGALSVVEKVLLRERMLVQQRMKAA